MLQASQSLLVRKQLIPSLHVSRRVAKQTFIVTHAKGEDQGSLSAVSSAVKGAVDVGRGVVEKAADLVPESVPRPVAKAGMTVVSGMLLIWLLQKLVSTVLTIALVGGVAYFYFTAKSGKESDNSGDSGDDDDEDPVVRARNIMNKYK